MQNSALFCFSSESSRIRSENYSAQNSGRNSAPQNGSSDTHKVLGGGRPPDSESSERFGLTNPVKFRKGAAARNPRIPKGLARRILGGAPTPQDGQGVTSGARSAPGRFTSDLCRFPLFWDYLVHVGIRIETIGRSSQKSTKYPITNP